MHIHIHIHIRIYIYIYTYTYTYTNYGNLDTGLLQLARGRCLSRGGARDWIDILKSYWPGAGVSREGAPGIG